MAIKADNLAENTLPSPAHTYWALVNPFHNFQCHLLLVNVIPFHFHCLCQMSFQCQHPAHFIKRAHPILWPSWLKDNTRFNDKFPCIYSIKRGVILTFYTFCSNKKPEALMTIQQGGGRNGGCTEEGLQCSCKRPGSTKGQVFIFIISSLS